MDSKPASLTTVIVASALICLVLGGLMVALRQELQISMAQTIFSQQEITDKLNRKITALEAQAAELAARPTTDSTTVDGLKNDLTTAKSTIDALTGRIATLETKPELVLPPPANTSTSASYISLKTAVLNGAVYQAELDIWEKEHPKSQSRIATLRQHAATGILTEEKLRDSLRTMIDSTLTGQESFANDSVASKLNKHFSGLISIKKQAASAPEMKAVRDRINDATLETLKAQVIALPPAQKILFDTWLNSAETRALAITELHVLDEN
jgi:hypothetical protein